jgi:hypothetical protein
LSGSSWLRAVGARRRRRRTWHGHQPVGSWPLSPIDPASCGAKGRSCPVRQTVRCGAIQDIGTSSGVGGVGEQDVSVTESDTIGAAGLNLAAGELLGVEPGVEPVVREEFGVRALLDDPAGL